MCYFSPCNQPFTHRVFVVFTDDLVSQIPGIDRTKEDQIVRIQELMKQNVKAEADLKQCMLTAESRRDEIRKKLNRVAGKALQIQEE
jgi:hypothetical protein